MTVALLAGVVFGLGLWLAFAGARPAPAPLGEALARVSRPPAAARVSTDVELDERDARVGALLLDRIPGLARRIDAVAADLRIVGRAPEEQAVRTAAWVLLPLLLGPWVAIVAALCSIPLPPAVSGLAASSPRPWASSCPSPCCDRTPATGAPRSPTRCRRGVTSW